MLVILYMIDMFPAPNTYIARGGKVVATSPHVATEANSVM